MNILSKKTKIYKKNLKNTFKGLVKGFKKCYDMSD